MKARTLLPVVVGFFLLGLDPSSAKADRVNDLENRLFAVENWYNQRMNDLENRLNAVESWVNASLNNLLKEVDTAKQLAAADQASRMRLEEDLYKEIWKVQRLSSESYSELRQRLNDIERRLNLQEQIIKNLARQ